MGKFFGNLNGVLIAGLVLAILIALLPDSGYANSVGANNLWLGIFQWLHVFFGITWIGLLYYFNFVQIPTMPNVPAELKPGVSKYIAPKALFYFRWGAAFTVLTGLIVAYLAIGAIVADGHIELWRVPLVLPQMALAILLFPLVARLVAFFDRVRLIRVRHLD